MVITLHPPEAINMLLDKLASDDQFRSQLIADPRATLESVGIEAEDSEIPVIRTLPSKAVIQANRAVLKSALGGESAMALFRLADS